MAGLPEGLSWEKQEPTKSELPEGLSWEAPKKPDETVTHKLATQVDTLASDVTAITHNTQADIPQDNPPNYVGPAKGPEKRGVIEDINLGVDRGLNNLVSGGANIIKSGGAYIGSKLGLSDGTYIPVDLNKEQNLPETETGAGYATEKTIPFLVGGVAGTSEKIAAGLEETLPWISKIPGVGPLLNTTMKLGASNAPASTAGAVAETPTDTSDIGKEFLHNEVAGIAGEAAFGGMLPTFAKIGVKKGVSDNINKVDKADAKINEAIDDARNATDQASADAAHVKWQEGLQEKGDALTKIGVPQEHIEQAHTELSVFNDINNNGGKMGTGLAIKNSQIPNASDVYSKLDVNKSKSAKVMSKLEQIPGFRDPKLKAKRVEAVTKTAEQNGDTLSTLPQHDLTDQLKSANQDLIDGKYADATAKLDAIKQAWANNGIRDGFAQTTGVDANAFSKQLLYTDTLNKASKIARGTKRSGSPVVDTVVTWAPRVAAVAGTAMHAAGIGMHIPGGYATTIGVPAAAWVGKKALNAGLSGNVRRGLEQDVAVTGGEFNPTVRQNVAAGVASQPQAVIQAGVSSATAPEPDKGPIYPDVPVQSSASTSEPTEQPSNSGLPEGLSWEGPTTPPEQEAPKSDDNPVGTILFNAFRVPETGGLKNPYIRTMADSKAGPSSAIGPVQITGTRVKDFITRHADKLTPEELAFAKDWVEYAKLTLHAPKGSGHGHGEEGILKDPHSKEMYDSIAKKMLYQTYIENGQDIHKTVYSWTGPHAWSQHYENAVISNIKPIGA